MNDQIDAAKLLLTDPRVDPSDDKNRAIRIALEKDHDDIVKLLLADPRTNRYDIEYEYSIYKI